MVQETGRTIWILRILTFLSGIGLIILGIVTFISFGFGDIRGFFLRIYYILFGILVCFTEMPCEKLLSCFHFLTTYLGKALFLLFLATITFTWDPIYYLIISIVFACNSIVYFVLFFSCTSKEASPNDPPKDKGENAEIKFEKREDVNDA